MSFEEGMTAFYVALAEEKLEQATQALGSMRLAVANDRSGGGKDDPDAALREEVRQSVISRSTLYSLAHSHLCNGRCCARASSRRSG